MIKEKLKTKTIKKCIDSVISICEKNRNIEICGFVGEENGNYVIQECENIAINKTTHFAVDPVEYLVFKEKYNFIFLFHSHIAGDEKPSEFDVVMSENSCVPFFVYSLNTKKSNIYIPQNCEADVLIIEKFKKKI